MVKIKLSGAVDGAEVQVSTLLTDVVLSLIEATYTELESVSVPNPTATVTDDDAGDFLSFILAFPPGVKTPVVKVEPVASPASGGGLPPTAGRIVLCSGGTDSSAAMLDLIERGEQFRALWCDYGQEYNLAERSAVRRICEALSVSLVEAQVDLGAMIKGGVGRFTHIVPARNLLIAAIAASLRPAEIVLAGLGDELMVPDKSPRMYAEGSRYLGCRIYSPFTKMNKTEIMCVWRKRWLELLSIDETVSCFAASGNCQNCSACAKREVSRIASGHSVEFPVVFDRKSELIQHHWFSRMDVFPPIRRAEILIALMPFVGRLTDPLNELVIANSERYAAEVAHYRDHFRQLSQLIA